MNASTAQPPSDGLMGYNCLCLSHLESLAAASNSLFSYGAKDGFAEVRCSAERSPIVNRTGAIGKVNLYMKLQHLEEFFH